MRYKVDLQQRRARLGVRQLLSGVGGHSAEAVADAVVALHATDPATPFLSVAARNRDGGAETGGGPAVLERALYAERSLLRLLGMRRTMFVARPQVAALIQAGCALDVAERERRKLEQHLGAQGYPEPVADPGSWLAEVLDATAAALAARGSATAQELAEDEPRLQQRLRMAEGKPYEAIGKVTSRVLFLLGAQGRIARGRPGGSWLSRQYQWSTMDGWLPGGLEPWSPEEARTELARRWLYAYGPAPVTDLRWWGGWTLGQTRKALAGLELAEVELDEGPGVLLADDLEPVPRGEPWVALLPALDPTPMGWSARDWFLGPHRDAVFDRTGNVGPTVWVDGRIAGAWAQRRDGEVVFRMLADVGADFIALIEAEAARIQRWLGPARVIPSFRTPVEKELAT